MQITKAVNRAYKVYKHVFPNGKVYIGITSAVPIQSRWRDGKGYRNNPHMTHAVQKYGWDNVEHFILKGSYSLEEANAKEIELIAKYKSNNPLYGYNITAGGDGQLGIHRTLSEASKKKISIANKGRVRTPEMRQKVSQAKRGKPLSRSTIEKMAQSHRGKPLSEAHKEAIRKGSIGKPGTFTGRKHTEETKRKMSEARALYWARKRGDDNAN